MPPIWMPAAVVKGGRFGDHSSQSVPMLASGAL
jgi:hypothetical protein